MATDQTTPPAVPCTSPAPREPAGPTTPSNEGHQAVAWGQKSTNKTQSVRGEPGTAPLDPNLAPPIAEVFGYKPAEPAQTAPKRRAVELQDGTAPNANQRQRVWDTSLPPWRQVCCLQMKFPRGVLIGTGALIGPRAVATAAHCVYDPEYGGKAEEVVVTPGRNGKPLAGSFGFAVADHFIAPKGWIEGDAYAATEVRVVSPFDYAVILLPTDLGTKPGWMTYASLAQGDLQSRQVNTAGYALDADPKGTTQWWDSNVIADVTGARLFYDLKTFNGQSGSPIWTYEPTTQERQLVGIHTSYTGAADSGVRITDQVRTNLTNWRDQT